MCKWSVNKMPHENHKQLKLRQMRQLRTKIQTRSRSKGEETGKGRGRRAERERMVGTELWAQKFSTNDNMLCTHLHRLPIMQARTNAVCCPASTLYSRILTYFIFTTYIMHLSLAYLLQWVSEQFLNGTSAHIRLFSAIYSFSAIHFTVW